MEGPNPRSERQAVGRSRHNKLVYFDGDGQALKGQLVQVRAPACCPRAREYMLLLCALLHCATGAGHPRCTNARAVQRHAPMPTPTHKPTPAHQLAHCAGARGRGARLHPFRAQGGLRAGSHLCPGQPCASSHGHRQRPVLPCLSLVLTAALVLSVCRRLLAAPCVPPPAPALPPRSFLGAHGHWHATAASRRRGGSVFAPPLDWALGILSCSACSLLLLQSATGTTPI